MKVILPVLVALAMLAGAVQSASADIGERLQQTQPVVTADDGNAEPGPTMPGPTNPNGPAI